MVSLDDIVVGFRYGDGSEVRALDRVSLTIGEGEFVTVVGNNGAGKSTLLNVVAGTIVPIRGRVVMNGTDVTRWDDARRARWVARVFASAADSTCGPLTIEENFAVALRRGGARGLRWYLGKPERNAIRERVRLLGLGLEDRLGTPMELLSSGQRQSLSVLMATMTRPKVLLLDEHVANLDPGTQERVMGLSERLVREQHLTTLMVTHDIEHALRYGDRLVALERGRIVLDVAGKEKADLTEDDLQALYRKPLPRVAA